jgi:hypothetical protein
MARNLESDSDDSCSECYASQTNLNGSGSLAAADDNMEHTDNPPELGVQSLQDEDSFSTSDNESDLGLGSDSEEWQDVPEEDDEESLELYDTYHTDY